MPTYVALRTIGFVVSRLGDTFRLSAPELDVISDGHSIEVAWERFLGEVSARDDAAWLMFDVGPTRPEEIQRGLDAPEDEDWAQPCDANGAD